MKVLTIDLSDLTAYLVPVSSLIKWEGCGRKGIQCKNGRWWRWVID